MAPSDFIDEHPKIPPSRFQVTQSKYLIGQANNALDQNNITLANELTFQALRKNITNGEAFAQLLANELKKNSPSAATDQLAKFAEDLWPSYTGVHFILANYWLQKNDIKKMLHSWNILMTRTPSLRKDIYPALLQLLNYQDASATLQPYVEKPPTWWLGFFNYIAKQQDLPQLRAIYQLRDNTQVPITPEERTTYINTLIKNKFWEEAYFAWLAGLDESQLKESYFVYNGSFETTTKATGFDWQFKKTPLVKIELGATNGMVGQTALHLTLLDQDRINFQNISQIIKLNSGAYSFSLRYRIDRLQTNEGLRWRIRCLDEKNTLLGESKALAARSSWDELTFSFEIPPSACPMQLIRLEASSTYAHNQSYKGNLWFDDIHITRQQTVSND